MTGFAGALLLGMFWIAVTGSITVPNILFGIALSFLCLHLSRQKSRAAARRVRLLPLLALGVIFVREIVLSAWRVAVLVLRPRMGLKPGIFAYPLSVDSDFEITLLANMITLTPGTLSVDVSADNKLLYVHAIDCSDPEQAMRDIEFMFERRIKRTFG